MHTDPYVDLPIDQLRERMRLDLIPCPASAKGAVQRVKPGTIAHQVLRVYARVEQASVRDVVEAIPDKDPAILRNALGHLARTGHIERITGYPPHVWRLRASDPTRR